MYVFSHHHFHTIKSILNKKNLFGILYLMDNFHTIKSILNHSPQQVKQEVQPYFHTIKSILNISNTFTAYDAVLAFPYY